MKFLKLLVLLVPLAASHQTYGQSAEVEQLLLNAEKLTQLKNILADMKRGYSVLTSGYNAVRNVAEGNFNLREAFMTGLKVVSPEVRKYPRITLIVQQQGQLVTESRKALSRFRTSGGLGLSDLDYLENVYSSLLKVSARNLEQLLRIITTSELEMSDGERLKAIDDLFNESSGCLSFLSRFNQEVQMLSLQRSNELNEIKNTKSFFP